MTNATTNNFIKNIRYFMYQNSLHISDLAKLSKIDRSTLTRIIKENRLPSKTVLAKISAATGIDKHTLVNSLFDEKTSLNAIKIPLYNAFGEITGTINSINANADSQSCIAIETDTKFNLSPLIPEGGMITAKIIHPLSAKNNDILLIQENQNYQLYLLEINDKAIRLLNGHLVEQKTFPSQQDLCDFKIVAKVIGIEAKL